MENYDKQKNPNMILGVAEWRGATYARAMLGMRCRLKQMT